MLAAASFLVHRLGLSQYGLWMLATAVANAMESLGSGFGDAAIKFVSKYRGLQQPDAIARVVQVMLAINGGFGVVLAIFVVSLAPFAAKHVFRIDEQQIGMSIRMLQVAGVIMLARSVENVFANTLRAFERYGSTVRISIAMRTLSVVAAVILAYEGRTALAIMLATLVLSLGSLALQAAMVRSVCGPITLLPSFDRKTMREVFGFGAFSWLQALAAVIFNNADRLVVGSILGTSALGIYAVCVQATQPIHGIAASALNFIFPHVSSKYETGDTQAIRRVTRIATWANLGLVSVLAAPLVIFSRQILSIWMGPAFPQTAHFVLSWLAVANACLGASVAAHYVLLAMGQARFVALVNILGGVLSLGCIALLMPHFGLQGAAIGRLFYAAAVALNFWKLRARSLIVQSRPASL